MATLLILGADGTHRGVEMSLPFSVPVEAERGDYAVSVLSCGASARQRQEGEVEAEVTLTITLTEKRHISQSAISAADLEDHGGSLGRTRGTSETLGQRDQRLRSPCGRRALGTFQEPPETARRGERQQPRYRISHPRGTTGHHLPQKKPFLIFFRAKFPMIAFNKEVINGQDRTRRGGQKVRRAAFCVFPE